MRNLVSIVMPTYNCGKFIEESILSVIAQTYEEWELIIIDDCSKDNTDKIVSAYSEKDKRIKYEKLFVNSGAAIARNKGIEKAEGKYIAFLDSDDLWTPNKLEKQLSFMQNNDYNFTCTAYEQIAEEGESLNKIIKTKPKTNYNGVLLSCPIGNSTVIYNVEKLGKFVVPNIKKRNDDALWLKILRKENYVYGMSDVLMKYRIRKNSISSNKFDLIKYHWYLYRKIENLSLLRSIFHIVCWGVIKILNLK